MKNKPHDRKNVKQLNGIPICILIGVFSTVIIFFLLITLFSCITLNMKSPHSYITPLSFFAIYTSSFSGGFIATKKNNGRDALLCGTVSGITSAFLLCLLFLAIGAILNTQSAPISWLFRALSIVFSVFGALLATKKVKKAPHSHKRRKK